MQVQVQRSQSASLSIVLSNPSAEQSISLSAERSRSSVTTLSDRADFAVELSSRKILEKIDAKLKELGGGDPSVGLPASPSEAPTPDEAAERVIKGVTSLFEAYASGDDGRSSDEKLDAFMKAARSGVEQGFDEAYSFLEAIGAFEVEGVEDRVLETKRLIDEKLNRFEELKRGGSPEQQVSDEVAKLSSESISVVA